MQDSHANLWGRVRRYAMPLMLLAMVLALLVSFRAVLLPFFVAIFVVVLIEPVVARLARVEVGGRQFSRTLAVLVVYTVGITGLTLFIWLFAPALGRELSTLPEDGRAAVQKAQDTLRVWSERIDEFSERLAPADASDDAVAAAQLRAERELATANARVLVHGSVAHASRVVRVLDAIRSEIPDTEVRGLELGQLPVSIVPRDVAARGLEQDRAPPVLFRVQTSLDGVLEILPGDGPVVVQRMDDGTFVIGLAEEGPTVVPVSGFQLERVLGDSLQMVAESSGKLASDALLWSQRMIGGLIQAMLKILVTLMVAAFISIDVPRILRAFVDLFPPEARPTVKVLLRRLNVGLAGVIRGQLMICTVNGILTWVGLWLLDVKFAAVLAVIAGVLSLIPIFGTILSTIPAVLVAIATGGFIKGVLVLAWILAIHFVEANMLNPKILGSAAKIHPAIVVLALVVGEHTFGLVGALLAVPAASIVQTLFLFARDHLRVDLAEEIRSEAASADACAVAEVSAVVDADTTPPPSPPESPDAT